MACVAARYAGGSEDRSRHRKPGGTGYETSCTGRQRQSARPADQDAGKGRSQQGLELDVFDQESGNIRSIKTLSGGESFKAALSLALGLSRMVQDYAGGIELNTLFIDEGFGSLDSQSLDQAMNCLMELHHENKLIGIISHVSDLKDRIERQLVVERKQKQSVIQMI